jgi:triphosphoribosyl-dephospho-CoA synthase
VSLKDKVLSIKTFKDLTVCLNLASLLEISGWPKPGNIHRTQNFEDTRFEHFLVAISAIYPKFEEFCSRIDIRAIKETEDYSYVKLGTFFIEAVKEMMKWQRGGNVVLGHILILAPLAAAATICLRKEFAKFNDFSYTIKKVIDSATTQDTLDLYEAIKFSNPGGLGKVEKYDINDENSLEQIKSDKVTLKQIFELSKDYDLISNEYSTGFAIILNEGLPYYFDIFNQTNDINIATVNTFLKILSNHPDTLIIRKSGRESALSVSKKAKEILDNGGIATETGLKLALDLDKQLQDKKGKMNPGTTADIIAGIIFCALIFGVRF